MQLRCLCTMSALAFILAIGLLGCSGGGGVPTMPDVTGTDLEISSTGTGQGAGGEFNQGNRQFWGLYMMHVNADHTAIDVEPLRDADFHFNVVGFLENPPGTQLIRIVEVSWSDDDTLLVDIQLIHPFGSNNRLTGRDVRGIAILPYIKKFPGTWLIDEDGVPEQQVYASRYLLNADGYSSLWNRWTADEVLYPQIFGYIRGKMATPDEFYIQGNLHGYRNFFSDDLQHVFQSGQGVTKKYEFDFPPGPLSFAYAVDASWEPPINIPVDDIFNDFPISANCSEPYEISTSIISNTLTKIGGSATVQFDVRDWQDPTNFSHVHVEAPDLFYGTLDLTAIGPVSFPDAYTATYQVVIPNTVGNAQTANGGSDLLIVVEDIDNLWTNPDLTAYHIVKLPVQDVAGFWRDRGGDSSFINVPLDILAPSSLSTGSPDIAVVSYPEEDCDFFDGDPEIMLFDDNDSRFVVYNHTLTASWPKAGYPFDYPPSWLLYPHCMDSNNAGWFGVGSTNETSVVGNYRVKHLINMFTQCGIYGTSWHTGTDDGGPSAFLETIRDVTAGMGNVIGDPVYGLFAYDSGAIPDRAYILTVGYPYIDPGNSNTFRNWIPLANSAGVPQAINPGADRLRCGIDTEAIGLQTNHHAFYVVESNPISGNSEVEGFDINFMYMDPSPLWNLTNADISSEFPFAWAVDCEVVPSFTNHVTISGTNTAQFNWLCVLMTDGVHAWLAFYDPLNPSPDNPGNNNKNTIHTSNNIPLPALGLEPVAMDVDHQNFEVYVLCRDGSDNYFVTVFEFFY